MNPIYLKQCSTVMLTFGCHALCIPHFYNIYDGVLNQMNSGLATIEIKKVIEKDTMKIVNFLYIYRPQR